MRILVVANKTWEAEPLVAAWTEKKARPAALIGVEVDFHPARPNAERGARLRAAVETRSDEGPVSGQVEVWCVEDALPRNKSSSHDKYHIALPSIRASAFGGAAPDVVVAFGTAGIPADVSHNGCVVVGTRVYIHDPWENKPRADRAEQEAAYGPLLSLPASQRDVAIESPKRDPNMFRAMSTDMRHAAEARFVPVPVHADTLPRILAGHGYAALSTINVSNYDDYVWADAETLDLFAKHVRQREIGSMETTHGLIRLRWPEARFVYVSGLTDRVGHFNAEVTPRVYAQNFVAAHNAGVAAGYLVADVVRLWGAPRAGAADRVDRVDRVDRTVRAAERIAAGSVAALALTGDGAPLEAGLAGRGDAEKKRTAQVLFGRRANVEKAHASHAEAIRRERVARFRARVSQGSGLHALSASEISDTAAAFAPARRRTRILAEGDSWFDYPEPFVGSVIDHLETMLDASADILSLAHAGDEVRQMLGREQAERLVEALTDTTLGPFDVLLFSGGGNDIVGDQLSLLIEPHTPGAPASSALSPARVDAILAWVMAGYDELLKLRDTHSPGTWILLHGYDFAPVTGKGVCFVGPWLEPSLVSRGWTVQQDQDAIVRQLLEKFAERLAELARSHPRVSLVPTQGTLNASEWGNEIHPNNTGFKKIAQRFAAALAALP